MHIKISKSSLTEALNNVSTVVASKGSLPILQNVKVEAKDGKATFVCSDLDTTLLTTADCEVLEEGATTIPVKTFSVAASKVVDGIVEVTADANDVSRLSAGTSMFSFKGISVTEFPTLKEEDGLSISIPSAAVREMLRKTAFAMCVDETRATLNAVLLDFSCGNGKVVAVATDGRRLSLLNCALEIPKEFNVKFVLPRKAVDALLKKLPKDGDCTITSFENQVRFSTPKLSLQTKLIDATYPNYMQVVPKESKEKIVVDRVELAGAIDRISVFSASADTSLMILVFEDNKISLTSGETEYGSARDEVPIKYEGERIEMQFNPQYVREALNVIDEDEIEIALANVGQPAVIRKAAIDDYTYVVMPLRKV